MRRIGISVLGALLLPLATPTAPGQVRPKVQVQKPRVEEAPRRAVNFGTYLNRTGRRELEFKAQMENAAELVSREELQKVRYGELASGVAPRCTSFVRLDL